MTKASSELLDRTVKLLWKYGYTEEEIMVLLSISRERIKTLRKGNKQDGEETKPNRAK